MRTYHYTLLLLLCLCSPMLKAQDFFEMSLLDADTLTLEETDPAKIVRLGEVFERSHSRKSDQKAFEMYCKAMAKDYAPAYRKLGDCYRNGVGVKTDQHKAFKLYRVAAQKGDSKAWSELGDCYDQGIGTDRSFANAFKCYSLACNADVPSGIYRVAQCFEHGVSKRIMQDSVGIEKDIHVALYYYQKLYEMSVSPPQDSDPINRIASKDREPEAMYLMAMRDPYTEDAFRWLRDAAARAYPVAVFELAKYYDYAYPQEYNPKHALRYYLLAAELGYSEAEFEVATLYETGRLVGQPDLAKALHWYQKSADDGIAYAAVKVKELQE